MANPREFWIAFYRDFPNILSAHEFKPIPGINIDPDTNEVIHVREVVPINWEKVYAILKIHHGIELLPEDKKALEELVEKQLAGEE